MPSVSKSPWFVDFMSKGKMYGEEKGPYWKEVGSMRGGKEKKNGRR